MERDSLDIIIETLGTLGGDGVSALEIADTVVEHMQTLYPKIEKGQYTAETIFRRLAKAVSLEESSTLHKMCVVICKDIDKLSGKELPYHNKQHFIEAMINCFILGRTNGLDDDIIAKLLCAGLAHDFGYPGKNGTLVPNEKYGGRNTASSVEHYSCDQLRKCILAEEGEVFDEQELGEVENLLELISALIATTDFWASETKRMIEAVEQGKEFESTNTFLQDTFKYFHKLSETDQENFKSMMHVLLLADIFSSCVLGKDLSGEKNERYLNGELERGLPKSKIYASHLGFLGMVRKQGHFQKDGIGYCFREQFDSTMTELMDARKKEEYREYARGIEERARKASRISGGVKVSRHLKGPIPILLCNAAEMRRVFPYPIPAQILAF
ncbi:HD domain-containing protein [Pseudomonadota bacterium]